MKSLALVVALLLIDPVVALAQNKKERDPNPTRDRDVQQGIDQHREDHRQRDTRETYTIHRSGEGHGGSPTSGGFAPSDIKPDRSQKK
jgi:hypothetical protein